MATGVLREGYRSRPCKVTNIQTSGPCRHISSTWSPKTLHVSTIGGAVKTQDSFNAFSWEILTKYPWTTSDEKCMRQIMDFAESKGLSYHVFDESAGIVD